MGKYSNAVTICLFSLILLALSGAIHGQTIGPVTLFQGPNGSGAGQDIPPGTYRVNGKELGSATKDPVFSVKVAKGFSVRFCDEPGTSGEAPKCEEFTAGTNNLKSIDFKLIKVWKEAATIPPVMVFEAENWGGRSQVYLPGMYRADRNEFGKINDNLAKSAVIAKGFRVRFCVEEGQLNARGAGECEEHEEGKYNLRFADSISFIEVIDLNDKSPAHDKMPVTLYEDNAQGGKMQGFDVGTFLASLGQFGKVANDTASSVVVKNGYRVQICPDEAPGDKCEELGPGKYNLKLKDTASYIKVWKSDK